MSTLGVGRKAVIAPHYPHMLAEDAAVWTRYLEDPVVPILEVWYDVRVGKPVELPPGATEMEKKIAAGLTRKRIDVIVKVEGFYWVVELKPFGGYVAYGQVLTYFRLFRQEYRLDLECLPVIICIEVDRDLLVELDEKGVVGIEV